ncbi:MAG: DUF3575 domain-containing protein [Spirosomaceae bacterium]|jgi:hypothetical protein|nr:DUF3575 domain-containing protein [Spirosomataceae bacterium]
MTNNILINKKIFLFIVIASLSQSIDINAQNNILKLNLSSLLIKSYSAQYEKVIGKRVSFALGAGYRPMSLVPFPTETANLTTFVDNRIDYISLDNTRPKESKVKGYHITPEIKFYFGQKEAPYGFYISAFARYYHVNAVVPVEMELEYRGFPVLLKLPVDTKVDATSLGLMFGKQFKISKRITMDWYIAGPHFGRYSLHGESQQDLSNFDDDFQNRLRTKVVDSFKIDENTFGVVVDDNGIKMDALRKLPFVNLRAFGFNLGYRF